MTKRLFQHSYLLLICIMTALLLNSCKKEATAISKTSDVVVEESETITKSAEAIGKEIFEGKGNCVSCHQLNVKVIGPSIKDVARIYKQKKGNIVAFLKEEAEPIVDPSQYAVMKTNFAITEEMSDEELQSLEAYIYSSLK